MNFLRCQDCSALKRYEEFVDRQQDLIEKQNQLIKELTESVRQHKELEELYQQQIAALRS